MNQTHVKSTSNSTGGADHGGQYQDAARRFAPDGNPPGQITTTGRASLLREGDAAAGIDAGEGRGPGEVAAPCGA